MRSLIKDAVLEVESEAHQSSAVGNIILIRDFHQSATYQLSFERLYYPK